jgi:hypothetical protein
VLVLGNEPKERLEEVDVDRARLGMHQIDLVAVVAVVEDEEEEEEEEDTRVFFRLFTAHNPGRTLGGAGGRACGGACRGR